MKLSVIVLAFLAVSATACCKVCRKGKPCGRTCISRHKICRKPTTCACTAAEASTQPAYNQPAYNQPAYNQPAYNQPAYNQPAYNQPAYNQPAYNQPATKSRKPNYVDYANLALNILSYTKL
jgi:hypothetical protein